MIGKFLIGAAAMAAGIVSAQAGEGSHWKIGGRLIAVVPDESATISVIGGGVEINNSYVPELDITYYFDPHWSLELIAATMPHEVHHTPTNLDLGKVWLLPPTLTLQYHFSPGASFQPYIGVGVNYTVFYNQGDEAAGINVDYENAFGVALVAGFDVPINDNWAFNVDVKKLFLNSEVTVTVLPSTIVKADVDIDPWVIGVGFNYSFN
jgi:outer membrane protein